MLHQEVSVKFLTPSAISCDRVEQRFNSTLSSMQIQDIELKKLKPWEKNPRINDHAVDAVVKSISQFGFNVPILCDPNFTIIAGHTRWKAAKNLKLRTVPVVVLELTDTQRKAFSIADNKTAEIAKWDFPQLGEILAALSKNFSKLVFTRSRLLVYRIV